MSIVRALDSDHDWLFGKGRNDYKSGIAATVQNIDTRLLSFLGDCFFDVVAGIDWFNLEGAKDQEALKLAVSAVILNTPNVLKILSLVASLDHETRDFTITYKVQAFNTDIVISGTTTANAQNLLTQSGEILETQDGEFLEI